MKGFAVSLIATVLAFIAGLVTATSWKTNHYVERMPVIVNAAPPCPRAPTQFSVDVSSPSEFDFSRGNLRVVPERVRLKSDSLRYDIDVKYPQIVALTYTEGSAIRKINQNVKDAATKLYQWPLSGNTNLYETSVGYKIVNFTYEVTLATESHLSISFVGYSYASGGDYPTSQNFSLNYDLKSGKVLKLNDIFKPGSKYLEFISHYCKTFLASQPSSYIDEGLTPTAANFGNWYFSSNGVTFRFAACKVRGCVDGDQTVEIPLSDLTPMLNPDLPDKLNVIYP